ncbi:copper amine oxidase N-terminal domain-containing protein [Zhenhengia yiwuensis]|uniref:Copper amine oxidase N-terminal domain-containing protein n=1 Tax=Zhenhengia yiwuensis TaxID=2763666 RepID=A0A926EN89_9FIRM|nr:copper amine oxidase N-terminal domain-containing protein [Zhenhengia yiwuensis]MBC8581397.1 copper amine oxidase N-terminal domain-containing protein [Zhenhengia yiwuensis]
MKKLILVLGLSMTLSMPVMASKNEIKITINGIEQTLTNKPKSINGTTYLPLRELGDLLNLKTEYLKERNSVSVVSETQSLDISLSGQDSVALIENGKTYLPLRFISENLGYGIIYDNGTILITTEPTEGNTPDVPNTNGQLDVSNMNPSDPNNAHNLNAFKDGRSLSVLPKAQWSQVKKPEGASDRSWNNCSKVYSNGVIMATGKLSDMPKDINKVYEGKEDFEHSLTTVPKISVNSKGVLVSSRGGAPTMILFKDGTTVQVDNGADASMGRDENGNYKPGKGVDDIACVVVADTQARAAYVFQVTGE